MKDSSFHCSCGARIVLSPEQKGESIVCVACGQVHAQTEPSEGHEQADDRYAWLEELAPDKAGAPPPEAPEVYDLADEPEATPPPFPIPDVVIEAPMEEGDEEEDDDPGRWDNPPERPFWQDLLASFTLIFETGNLITFGVIVAINIWSVFLSFAGFVGFIGLFILSCYLAAFYLSVIRETAGGEDDLPSVWIHNFWDDLFLPWLQFALSGLIVMIPAFLLMIGCVAQGVRVPWEIVAGLAIAGLFFWPVVILGVAIGGGFQGLWPHTIVQTVLAAPMAFLTIWGVLLISGGLYIFGSQGQLLEALIANVLPNRTGVSWLVMVVSATISAYAAIVAMRTIGLFYRHFKKQLPWKAE